MIHALRTRALEKYFVALMVCVGLSQASCTAEPDDRSLNNVGAAATGGAAAVSGAGATGGVSGAMAGVGAGMTGGASGTGMTAGTTGGAGATGGATGGASGTGSDAGGMTGGDAGGDDGSMGPLTRAPGFANVAPPLGEPLPPGTPGEWRYIAIEGAVCRDGTPAGLFYKYSATSTNYFIFLEGGGVCFDDFFCPINPKNVMQKVDGHTVLEAGLTNLGGAAAIPQAPRIDGMFKNDPRNPVADWNAIYIPYCSGDVYGGTKSAATVPNWTAGGPQEFQGYRNTGLMFGRIVATFMDAEKALLTGSSAGGVGSLMNAAPFADILGDNTQTRGFVVSDSGPVFDDPYLEVCLQAKWRALWGLNDAFPPDCEECKHADGSGIAKGVGQYLFQKLPAANEVVGGIISTVNDEVMQLFFGKGLDNCVGNPFYPAGRYQQGLENFRDEITDKSRFGTYFMQGSLHMHIFTPRFYEMNGTTMTIAEWLTKLLDNEVAHAGP